MLATIDSKTRNADADQVVHIIRDLLADILRLDFEIGQRTFDPAVSDRVGIAVVDTALVVAVDTALVVKMVWTVWNTWVLLLLWIE
jgi:hypothetical protein